LNLQQTPSPSPTLKGKGKGFVVDSNSTAKKTGNFRASNKKIKKPYL